jgi:protein SCO1
MNRLRNKIRFFIGSCHGLPHFSVLAGAAGSLWGPHRATRQKILFYFCMFFVLTISISLPAAEPTPYELQGIAIKEHLGKTISKDLTFTNEEGQAVALEQFFDGKHPVVLSLAYYGCPNLCQFLLNGVTDAFKGMSWTTGDEFTFVNVSIDHQEGPELAKEKKANHIKEYERPEGAPGWHFLTGSKENIKKLADEIGFGFRYDADQKQYAHGAAVFVLTPEGKIARYLYGIEYKPRDVKLALLEASEGKVGSVVDKFLLYCYHYDPKGKKYALMATNVMKGAGAVTVLALAGFIIPLARRYKQQG